MGKGNRLGKEAKIGLVVVAVLAIGFAGALGYRLWKNKAAAAEELAAGKPEKRPLLASGPSKPTLISPAEGSRRTESEDRYSRRRNEWAGSDKAIVNEFEKKSPGLEAEPRANYMPDVSANRQDERERYENQKTEAAFVTEPAGPGVSIAETPAANNEPANDPFKHNPPRESGMPPATLEAPSAVPMTVNPVVYPQENPPHNPLRAADVRGAAPPTGQHHLHAGDHYQSHLSGGAPPTNGHLNTAPPTYGHEHHPQASQSTSEHHLPGMNPLAPENLFHQAGNQHPPGEHYRVQPNESYWVISQKVYGTGAYFKALAEHNRDRYPRPDQIMVGDLVSVPSTATLAQAYPDLCPRPRHQRPAGSEGIMRNASTQHHAAGGRSYKVREGDTLFDIARYELGKASRWAEIYELNRNHLGEDFDYLAPGTELILPATGPTDPLTTRRTTPAAR